MRRFDWLMIIALVVVALAGKFFDFDDNQPPSKNPRRPNPEAFAPKFWDSETQAWMSQFPKKSENEISAFAELPAFGTIDDEGRRSSSVGSAFAIASNGFWLTARHVAAGCDKTYIQTGEKQALRVTGVNFHPGADIALLSTRSAPAPLTMSASKGQPVDGFGIGFPKGRPGAVHGRFIGEMTMYHRGRNGFREPVYAWTEQSRIPARNGSLGGLSGGALLDSQGRVIGIIEAESRRRGRFMTAKPETILELLDRQSVAFERTAPAGTALSLTPQFYPQIARQLITTLRVAKVLCFVE
ncbi:MAG: trypsin-like peptidase domain-containing protein [Rhodospirillales bacterium]|nr:trypsin-like peptidase domain-containing protein [Rhodospirillales bacterium]